MNRYSTAILTFISICICLLLWLNWRSLHDLPKEEFVHPAQKLDQTEQEFVPTNEWQPLGRDQPIPKGLHVRINLQTGEREAKLLEVEKDVDEEKKSMIQVVDEYEKFKAEEGAHQWKYLKESLKNIKNDANNAEDADNDIQPKKKFRTYEQLKEELSELNMNVKTDSEVLTDVLKEFRDKYVTTGKSCSLEEPELETILKNLENLLHQVDVAEEFSKRNGIHEIILPCLSSNSTSLRTISARVLGAAVQNNPKVQVNALKIGVMAPLLKTIALTNDYNARASSIFALSCLIRSFPFAEAMLIKEGGLDVLLSLFEDTSADALKLQMKVVSLFYDLVVEKDDAELTIAEEKIEHNLTDLNETLMKEMQQMQEKLKQYKDVDLKIKLIERGWCLKLSHVLSTRISSADFALAANIREDAVDHSMVDIVTKAMSSIAVECQQQLSTESTLVRILTNLSRYYERLIPEDDFYKDIHKTVQQLNSKLLIS